MYKNEIQNIKEHFENGDSIECINECFKLLKKINKDDIFNHDIIFDCYYKLSTMYTYIGNYIKAIKYAHASMMYTNNIDNSIKMNWTISFCFYKMRDIRALHYDERAIELCHEINADKTELELLVHKAAIIEDEQLMKYAINGLKRTDITEERMDYMYQDLFDIYKNQNRQQEEIETLHNIKSLKMRNKLYLSLYSESIG